MTDEPTASENETARRQVTVRKAGWKVWDERKRVSKHAYTDADNLESLGFVDGYELGVAVGMKAAADRIASEPGSSSISEHAWRSCCQVEIRELAAGIVKDARV